MKAFETPEIEIMQFTVEDIITSSGLRDDEFPIMPVGADELPITSVD